MFTVGIWNRFKPRALLRLDFRREKLRWLILQASNCPWMRIIPNCVTGDVFTGSQLINDALFRGTYQAAVICVVICFLFGFKHEMRLDCVVYQNGWHILLWYWNHIILLCGNIGAHCLSFQQWPFCSQFGWIWYCWRPGAGVEAIRICPSFRNRNSFQYFPLLLHGYDFQVKPLKHIVFPCGVYRGYAKNRNPYLPLSDFNQTSRVNSHDSKVTIENCATSVFISDMS